MVSNAARKNDRCTSTGMSVGLAADGVGAPKKKEKRKLGCFALCVKIRCCHSSAVQYSSTSTILVRTRCSNTELQSSCIKGRLGVTHPSYLDKPRGDICFPFLLQSRILNLRSRSFSPVNC